MGICWLKPGICPIPPPIFGFTIRRISCEGPRGICGLIGDGAPSDGDRVLRAMPGMAEFERRAGKELASLLNDDDIGGDPALGGEFA